MQKEAFLSMLSLLDLPRWVPLYIDESAVSVRRRFPERCMKSSQYLACSTSLLCSLANFSSLDPVSVLPVVS